MWDLHEWWHIPVVLALAGFGWSAGCYVWSRVVIALTPKPRVQG